MRYKDTLRRHQPSEIVRFIAHVPNFAKLFVRLLRDGRVSLFPKGLFGAGALYAISPMDFLPDLMPLLGQMDDLAILALVCRMFLALCPRPVVDEHVAQIDATGKWAPFEQPTER